GGQVPLEQWFAAPREAGTRAGITFNFDRITHAPNTTLSHQLIALAPKEKREAVIDAVYAAYFEHGQNIGALDVLVALAAEQGMNAEATRAALEDGAMRQAVLQEAQQAAQLGVTGVPFFVVNNLYAFSGAQPPQMITQVLQQASQEISL
ncbi:MAG: DsbA family protein, partial [Anaerolineales bacterium]